MAALKKGSKGGAVKSLQRLLNKAGAKPKLPEDGDFGVRTDEAVRAYQKKSKLKVDGVVGKKTMAKLEKPNDSGGGKTKPTGSGGKKAVSWPHSNFKDMPRSYESTVRAYEHKHQKREKTLDALANAKGVTGQLAGESSQQALADLRRDYKTLQDAFGALIYFLKPLATLQNDYESLVKYGKTAEAEDILKKAAKEVGKFDKLLKACQKATADYDRTYDKAGKI